MTDAARPRTMEEIDALCAARAASPRPDEPYPYAGPLARHVRDGDRRLLRLAYDPAPASLRLWNFLLTEEDRLREARAAGHKLVGAMKDLGTVTVLAYAYPRVTAFYLDGAWWIPCIMEMSEGLLGVASAHGAGEGMCPVRAMLGAFVTRRHFPIPDLLVSSVGAVCDDLSAVAQRLESLGHPILWWEMPARRAPEPGEPAVPLPGGLRAPASQVALVRSELGRVRRALDGLAGHALTDAELAAGIRAANAVRARLDALREIVFTAPACPLPALEHQIAEMLVIHFCSDRDETLRVYDALLDEVRARVAAGTAVLPADAVRVFWVNPVADLRAMNLLEACGGRLCGTEFLFCHALDPLPEGVEPMEALARAALADPMVGPASDRAARIAADARRFGAEAVVVSRIPGASHCAWEGEAIAGAVRDRLGLPVAEIEVPPLTDALAPSIRSRLEALVETARARRRR